MRVSIIITNYNYGRFLGRAIQSSLAQTVLSKGECEVVVVDDGSTDNSNKVIESYLPDIRQIRHEKQRGLPAAVNTGIKRSRGAYVLRLDADDWLDRHIAFLLSYFLDHNKEFGFVWPDYYVYDEHERILDRISQPQGAGVMFRKQLLVDVGLYDEEMLVHEDKDILLRCMDLYPGYHIKMPLYRYYRHGANMTMKENMVKHYEKILENKHGEISLEKDLIIDPGIIEHRDLEK